MIGPDEFRGLFPCIPRKAWFDTPGCPPGFTPVIDRLSGVLESWRTGDFSWIEWDSQADLARTQMADFLHVPGRQIALLDSVSQAVAMVVNSFGPGKRVLIEHDAFRSTLLPVINSEMFIVHPRPGGGDTLTERICEALTDEIDLVIVSTATTQTGARPDVAEIGRKARSVGAELFVNVTQSLGALIFDIDEVRPSYVTGHNYKWMLSPRGCAWLASLGPGSNRLQPMSPGWHSVEEPNGGYFGQGQLSASLQRLDGGLPWLSWLGGTKALEITSSLDHAAIEARILALSALLGRELADRGFGVAPTDLPSHILRVYLPGAAELQRRLSAHDVILSGNEESLRIGVHGFNNQEDVHRLLNEVDVWIRWGEKETTYV
jgi:selenocysteine lyase/cysteine desulfurase